MNAHKDRKIAHIDLDAFFASVEQRDNPQYRGIPIAVGMEHGRSVVSTASYEARLYGVKSGMSSYKAKLLCKNLVFVTPRYEVYKEISSNVMKICKQYTDIIEQASIDEAYLDLTTNKLGIDSATEVVKKIQNEIYEKLHITASVGLSTNKFIAKIASDYKKPNGLTIIKQDKVIEFIDNLPIEKFLGIGKVLGEKLKLSGYKTGKDLRKFNSFGMSVLFGKGWKFYENILNGIDDRPLKLFRDTKSISAEQTFDEDIQHDTEKLISKLDEISNKVSHRLFVKGIKGRTISIKVKYSNFKVISKSISINEYTNSHNLILEKSIKLLLDIKNISGKKIRLLGISISSLDTPKYSPQLELWQ